MDCVCTREGKTEKEQRGSYSALRRSLHTIVRRMQVHRIYIRDGACIHVHIMYVCTYSPPCEGAGAAAPRVVFIAGR